MKNKPSGEDAENRLLLERIFVLEIALLDYIETYGIREKARHVFSDRDSGRKISER